MGHVRWGLRKNERRSLYRGTYGGGYKGVQASTLARGLNELIRWRSTLAREERFYKGAKAGGPWRAYKRKLHK